MTIAIAIIGGLAIISLIWASLDHDDTGILGVIMGLGLTIALFILALVK